jgi:hypothetical protein
MSELISKTMSVQETKATLVCRLRHKATNRRGSPAPLAGEVEIENVSQDGIDIEWDRHLLQYLSLVITDAAGNQVPAAPYGDQFSPHSFTRSIFHLAPGEKYVDHVALLGGVAKEKRLPGTYTVRAVYRYKELTVVSEPVKVQVPAEAPARNTPEGVTHPR